MLRSWSYQYQFYPAFRVFLKIFCRIYQTKEKMVGNMLSALLVVSAVGFVFSNPIGSNQDTLNVPRCAQPAASGLCLAYFPSYYYNPSKETCESFIYGGCQGNQNRFATMEECISACGGFKIENRAFTLRPDIDEEELKEKSEEAAVTADPCKLKSEMGPCRAMFPRFYFNGDDCESFIYGGCQGNENNFKTVEECRQRCGSGSSVESESSEDENTVSSEEKSDEQSEKVEKTE